MTITVEATYENGTLKLVQPLPLRENEKVRVTVELEPSPPAARSTGSWGGRATRQPSSESPWTRSSTPWRDDDLRRSRGG